ncbi:MAG TPA: hypothetical protein DD413_08125 [Ruminococcus sp.]|nr:hypothetical protein [Ruminococcus sp.]
MKKVLSLIIIIILFVQLTACATENEKPHIKVYNYVNDYEAVLNIDNIKLTPSKGSMLAFESNLSAEEIMNALSESNPNVTFIKLNNREFLAKYNENCPYILFSKNVCDKNENIVDDVYVVMSESEEFGKIGCDIPYESMKIWYPEHLTNHYFTYEKVSDETYTLEVNNNPFESYVYLNESTSVFTDIVKFYEDCGYEVQHEGGNLTSGIIFVTPNTDDTNPFRILVMKKNDTYAMQYGIINSDLKQRVVAPITNYIDALNTKNAESYLSCFEDIDKSSIDTFLNNVKSCTLNNAELFWVDEENQQYIFKVDYKLVSEDGKMMGSLEPGEHTLVEYFIVGSDNKELKIFHHYNQLDDCIRELKNYKEFE